MANFKYVGTKTKPNGKVDLKLPRCSHGTAAIEVFDIVPNSTLINVTDPCHVKMLQMSRDVTVRPSVPNYQEI
jgi:hypothetical protein